jgi:hypothetical protein
MAEQRHAKRALLEGEGEKKRKGRPKKKWLEAVTADLRMLGVTDWRKASHDRNQWRQIGGVVTKWTVWDICTVWKL